MNPKNKRLAQRRALIAEQADRRRAAAVKIAELPNVTHCDEFGIELRFQIPVSTLRTWRCLGRGPSYVKVGRSVLYHIDTVAKFFEQYVRGAV